MKSFVPKEHIKCDSCAVLQKISSRKLETDVVDKTLSETMLENNEVRKVLSRKMITFCFRPDATR